MKISIHNIIIIYLAFFVHNTIYAQRGFEFRRKIEGNTAATFYTIPFTDDLYNKLKENKNFRILGITTKGDTVEAPYFWEENREKKVITPIEFQILNQSKNDKGYYFTFTTPSVEAINNIDLDFENENFDWKIDLEGSLNQNEWFYIIENQRITKLKNDTENYVFSTLNFPLANYRYWRICVKATEKPILRKASIEKKTVIAGTLKSHRVQMSQKDSSRHTIVTVDLDNVLPVSALNIVSEYGDKLHQNYNFHRNFQCYYLADSARNIWHKLIDDVISNKEKKENIFHFDLILTKKLKIIIENGDDKGLAINNIIVKGNPVALVTRLPELGTYYLYYGSQKNTPPQYDIEFFRDNAPENCPILSLGTVETLKITVENKEPLLKNKWWLWTLMLAIMLFLGYQTFKMMKKMS